VNFGKNCFSALEQWLSKSEHVTKDVAVEYDPDTALTAIDYEEQTAGYQAAFSKLAASLPRKLDLVPDVVDPVAYVKQTLSSAVTQNLAVRQQLTNISPSPWSRGLTSGQSW